MLRHRLWLPVVGALLTTACVDWPYTRSTTVLTIREPVPALRDSVVAPSPAGIASVLTTDTPYAPADGASQPDTRSPADAAVQSATARLCDHALRDPGTGARFRVQRTQVVATTTHPDARTTEHRLSGWGDYQPDDAAAVGLLPGQRLRVDCATHRVAGIAPGAAPDV